MRIGHSSAKKKRCCDSPVKIPMKKVKIPFENYSFTSHDSCPTWELNPSLLRGFRSSKGQQAIDAHALHVFTSDRGNVRTCPTFEELKLNGNGVSCV